MYSMWDPNMQMMSAMPPMPPMPSMPPVPPVPSVPPYGQYNPVPAPAMPPQQIVPPTMMPYPQTGLPNDKDQLGEILYTLVEKKNSANASKITGMLLEMEIDQIQSIIKDSSQLDKWIDEAMKVTPTSTPLRSSHSSPKSHTLHSSHTPFESPSPSSFAHLRLPPFILLLSSFPFCLFLFFSSQSQVLSESSPSPSH